MLTAIFNIQKLAPYLLICGLCFSNISIFAQSNLYDDGTDLWNSDVYIDESRKNEDTPDPIEELDTDDYQYYSNDELLELRRQEYVQSTQRIDYTNAVQESLPTLKDNILYGVGTGLVIGGWFAIFNKGTARENFQFLGSGAVLGGLMGFLVGTKAFYIIPPQKLDQPQQPQNQELDPYGLLKFPRNPLKNSSDPRLALDFEVNF